MKFCNNFWLVIIHAIIEIKTSLNFNISFENIFIYLKTYNYYFLLLFMESNCTYKENSKYGLDYLKYQYFI